MNGRSIPHFALDGILRARWQARLETPLCIKSGANSAFNPSRGGNKTRNVNMGYRWQKEKTDTEVPVSELQYAVEVAQGRAVPLYQIFSRSVRGALRGWSIRHLVRLENQNLLDRLTEHTEDETASDEALQQFKEALRTDSGLVLVYEIFGIASKSEPGTAGSISKQGNLKVEVSFSGSSSDRPQVQGDWQNPGNSFGPGNAVRNISVRGPLCRITQAAKSGGLHYFLEFSPGQQIDVTMTLRKPQPSHAGLLALWEREINAGLLRLGGLSSIGRGRLSLPQVQYDIIGTDAFAADWTSTEAEPVEANDVLSNVWARYAISRPDMDAHLMRLGQTLGHNNTAPVVPGE